MKLVYLCHARILAPRYFVISDVLVRDVKGNTLFVSY